jgi:glutamate/tyrosine decarboxylase-like PLP-dependent enzyme
MKDVFAYMIGPKGENADIFRDLLTEALDDHVFWRRNFHPEDAPVITANLKSSPDFKNFVDRLRDNMFQFLGEAKEGIPFFSPRYIGHMNTDLLLPALVGYFGAMLYNSNNVADESSPVTAQLEQEVVEMLLRMVGIPPKTGWGYLTSGGTAANIYSLWVARNLRTLPFSIREMLDQDASTPAATKALDALRNALEAETARGKRKLLLSCSAEELANIPSRHLWALRGKAVAIIRAALDIAPPDAQGEGPRLFDELINHFILKNIGARKLLARISKRFKQDAAFILQDWRIYMADNLHYSWPKSADLLGFGQEAIITIPHLPSFDLDVAALRDRILESRGQSWPFFINTIFGTTEEGALDNLAEVDVMLRELEAEHGLTLWHHSDACYGGYFSSMFRDASTNALVDVGDCRTPGTFKHWLAGTAEALGAEPAEAEELIEMSESGQGGWLSWSETRRRTEALARADSISIDPHKQGYIPYPCGAVLLQDGRAREVMSFDAPYLWSDTSQGGAGFTGRYTLEGSRPGAAAAACWLAHKTIPLDQSGHGRILALSILSARKLYKSLRQHFTDPGKKARIALVHQPQSNVVCYAPYHVDLTSLEENGRLAKAVLQALHPMSKIRHYMAVGTDVELPAGVSCEEGINAYSPFFKMLGARGEERVKACVIRSVVMGPYSLIAQTRPDRKMSPRPVFDEYAAYLEGLIQECTDDLLIQLAADRAARWPHDLACMVMDDDPTVTDQLRDLLAVLNEPKIFNHWQHYTTAWQALERIHNDALPLHVAFLDIDMSGSTSDPKGTTESGFHALQAIIERNRRVGHGKFRVQAVFIFSKGYDKSRVENLLQEDISSLRVVDIDKVAASSVGTREERLRLTQNIIREIGRLDMAGA